jgi:hypothetical protein
MEEYMNKNLRATQLRMPEIKDCINLAITTDVEQAGFRFRKSNFTYIKKWSGNWQKVIFLFYNYFPLDYKMHFLVSLWIEEIEQIKSNLPFEHHFESSKFQTLGMDMSDFMNEFGKKPFPTISGYTFDIATKNDLQLAATSVKLLLGEKVFPFLDQVSNLEGLFKFFESHPDWSVKSLSVNNMCSEIIVGKLISQKELKLAYERIIESLTIKEKASGSFGEMIDYVKKVYGYLSLH